MKTAGRNINNLRYADDTSLMAESKEELKSLLMKLKEKRKSWLKTQHSENKDHGIWSHQSWQTDGETVTDFIFLGAKITADSDCSHEIKRRFLLGRKAMTNLGSILKSRDITLPTKVHLVKAMVFPVVMYGCPTPVLLPGKSHGQRSLVGCSSWGCEESDTTEQLHFHFSLSCIGKGNGNPLQCSCLENPRDEGAWWAAIYGVTQSRT